MALVVYWLALFTSTHLPHPEIPFRASDKLIHFGAFAVLGLLVAAVAQLRWVLGPGRLAMLMLLIVAYATVDELLQIPVGRNADVLDWAADVAGAATGMILWIILAGVVRTFTAPESQ